MSEAHWTLGFIGAGVMAETMIAGVIEGGGFSPDRVLVADPNPSRREHLARRGVRVTANNREVTATAQLIVLAVKPQSLPSVFADVRGEIPPETPLLSIVAGASTRSLARGLRHDRVARAMPNLPCRVHRGMTIWSGASGRDAERIELVLRGMGQARQVDSESDVDRATAVSGTGPAIVAEFVKSMVDAANYVGLPRELAYEAVLATVAGTAEMIRSSDVHVAQLIDEVTSPAGTTSRALQVLKKDRFGAAVTDGVDAAYQRTLELGRALEERLAEE
jgi:pyrroline-5-carboxylate reductase